MRSLWNGSVYHLHRPVDHDGLMRVVNLAHGAFAMIGGSLHLHVRRRSFSGAILCRGSGDDRHLGFL